jgi:cytochrome c553
MTTTRTVYATFAVAAVAAIAFAACGVSGPAPGTPEALYVDLGCAKCHGENRQGQRSGPPLNALADRWQEESLLEYFADPKAVMEKNPRLKYMAENFPIVMPAYPDADEEDLRKLAQYILGS